MINTKVHASLDYGVAILLIASPWLFGFAGEGYATNVPIVLGLITIFYSMWTDYEYSMISAIPMRIHLALDVISGLILIVSPWVFYFSHIIYWPHIAVGVIELVVVSLSKRKKTNRR